MSYINEALQKAQKERDSRYGKFGGIIAAGSAEGKGRRPGRRLIWGAALAVLAAAALLPALLALRSDPPAGKEAPAAVSVAPVPRTGPVPETAGQVVGAGGEGGAGKKALPAGSPGRAVPGDPAAPAVPPGGREPAEARYAEALRAQRSGEAGRAQALYQEVLSLDPGHVRALNNLGVIHMALGQREKAAEVLSRAAALKKDYVDPYYNLACLYAQGGQAEESLRYLKMAAAADGRAIAWAREDADLKSVVASPEFKKLMEGQKN
jgi:hypothetical protein